MALKIAKQNSAEGATQKSCWCAFASQYLRDEIRGAPTEAPSPRLRHRKTETNGHPEVASATNMRLEPCLRRGIRDSVGSQTPTIDPNVSNHHGSACRARKFCAYKRASVARGAQNFTKRSSVVRSCSHRCGVHLISAAQTGESARSAAPIKVLSMSQLAGDRPSDVYFVGVTGATSLRYIK